MTCTITHTKIPRCIKRCSRVPRCTHRPHPPLGHDTHVRAHKRKSQHGDCLASPVNVAWREEARGGVCVWTLAWLRVARVGTRPAERASSPGLASDHVTTTRPRAGLRVRCVRRVCAEVNAPRLCLSPACVRASQAQKSLLFSAVRYSSKRQVKVKTHLLVFIYF